MLAIRKQIILLSSTLIALFLATTAIIGLFSYRLIKQDAREQAVRAAQSRLDRVVRKMASRGPPAAQEAFIYFALLDGRPAQPDDAGLTVQRYLPEPALEPERIYILYATSSATPITWPPAIAVEPELFPDGRVGATRLAPNPLEGEARPHAVDYLGAQREWASQDGTLAARLVVLSRVEPVGTLYQRVATVTLLTLLSLVFGTSLVVFFMQSRFDTRLRAINSACDEITITGDLERRINVEKDDELGMLARNIDRMLDEIQDRERLIALQDRFLDHDYRAPIAEIISAAETLKDTMGASDPVLSNQLAGILRTALRMNQGAQERLELYRFDRDVVEGNASRQERLNLREVAEEAADGNWVLAGERDVTVSIEGDEATEVIGSPSLILRAIGNLIRNAIQHSPPGGMVAVHIARDARVPSISVRDFGPGMPPAQRRAAMSATDLPRSTRPDGVGLGIESIRGIVKAHRAQLELGDANPGLIATIRFTPGLSSGVS